MAADDLDLLASPRRSHEPVVRENLFAGIKLVLLGVVLLLVTVLGVYLLEDDEPPIEEITTASVDAFEQPATQSDLMENPTLTRTDSKGRLFHVSAASAERASTDSEEVTLKDVRADAAFDSPFRDDDRMTLYAAKAVLHGESERLDIFAPMDIRTTSRYRLRADSLAIDIARSRIEEGIAIDIKGPDGSLTAKTMSTSADGRFFTFHGDVRLRWIPSPTFSLRPEPL